MLRICLILIAMVAFGLPGFWGVTRYIELKDNVETDWPPVPMQTVVGPPSNLNAMFTMSEQRSIMGSYVNVTNIAIPRFAAQPFMSHLSHIAEERGWYVYDIRNQSWGDREIRLIFPAGDIPMLTEFAADPLVWVRNPTPYVPVDDANGEVLLWGELQVDLHTPMQVIMLMLLMLVSVFAAIVMWLWFLWHLVDVVWPILTRNVASL